MYSTMDAVMKSVPGGWGKLELKQDHTKNLDLLIFDHYGSLGPRLGSGKLCCLLSKL
jgi:spore coat polysaccharide biosynthesis predicted glycosyltransferase SpsG